MEVTVSDVMAVAAFGLSAFSLWRQRRYDEQARMLNELLIEKEKGETLSAKRADLSANFVKTGKSSYRFRVFNRGKGVARGVRIEVLAGGELFEPNDLAEKFPYPAMDMHQSIDLHAFVHMQSPRRATIRLTWDDDAGGGDRTITDDVF